MRPYFAMALAFTVSLLPATTFASPTVTVLQSFDPMLGQLPESITSDDAGNLYFSLGGTLNKFTPERQLVTLATIPAPQGAATLGVKVGPDGFVYVVTAGFFTAAASAFVWRVSPTGQVSVFATLAADGIPNDLAFDNSGNLFVTDSALGQIWKIDRRGNPEVWFADPLLLGDSAHPVAVVRALGANGIAFDQSEHNLYVSNTDYGRVLRINLHHGKAQGIDVVAESDLLLGADGIAVDVRGTVYVAVNAADRIATVSRSGKISILVEGAPLDAPSSVVFGTRCSDRNTLYFTDYAVLRASGAKPGIPSPSLAAVPVPFPGLDLE